MKIVILSDDFPPKSFGGAGIVAWDDAKAFVKARHEVSVVTTVQDKSEEGIIFTEGIKVLRIFSKYHERFRAYRSLYNPAVLRKVKKFLKEEKPDIVHAHNIHYHISYHALKIAKKFSKRVFLTAHDAMLFHYGKLFPKTTGKKEFDYKISPFDQLREFRFRYNPFRNICIRYYLSYVHTIFSISLALKEMLNANRITTVKVIYNAIDVSLWQINQEKLEQFKKEKGIHNFPTVFFNGRLSYAKGFTKIIQAMKIVKEKVPNATLVVAGTQTAMTKDCMHLGWLSREEMKYAYALSSLVVFPSIYFDPFGLVNLEAMASHKPVIGTCFGGTPEIVRNNETGYIVNPNNEVELAEKIIDLLLDTKKQKRFGEAGFKRAVSLFNQDVRISKLLEEYQN